MYLLVSWRQTWIDSQYTFHCPLFIYLFLFYMYVYIFAGLHSEVRKKIHSSYKGFVCYEGRGTNRILKESRLWSVLCLERENENRNSIAKIATITQGYILWYRGSIVFERRILAFVAYTSVSHTSDRQQQPDEFNNQSTLLSRLYFPVL